MLVLSMLSAVLLMLMTQWSLLLSLVSEVFAFRTVPTARIRWSSSRSLSCFSVVESCDSAPVAFQFIPER